MNTLSTKWLRNWEVQKLASFILVRIRLSETSQKKPVGFLSVDTLPFQVKQVGL